MVSPGMVGWVGRCVHRQQCHTYPLHHLNNKIPFLNISTFHYACCWPCCSCWPCCPFWLCCTCLCGGGNRQRDRHWFYFTIWNSNWWLRLRRRRRRFRQPRFLAAPPWYRRGVCHLRYWYVGWPALHVPTYRVHRQTENSVRLSVEGERGGGQLSTQTLSSRIASLGVPCLDALCFQGLLCRILVQSLSTSTSIFRI